MKNVHSSATTFHKQATGILVALLLSFTAGNAHASSLQKVYQTKDSVSILSFQNKTTDTVYTYVDKMPEFPGGEKEVVKFLSQSMRYPDEALKNGDHGKVIVQFIIDKTGKVENAKVLKGVSKELDAEALRVVGLLPNWTPGEQNGEKVAVNRIIPIFFQGISPEDAWEANEKTLVVIDNVKMPKNFNPTIINFNNFATTNVLKPFPEKEKSRLISKYGKQAENGVILLTTNKADVQFSLPDSTIISLKDKEAGCNEKAILPTFPGGETILMKYIADSIQYPFVAKRTNTQGKVFVRFGVDTSGKVGNAVILKSVDYFLNKEALRVISSMPNWNPGSLCDKKLNFLVTVPVNFTLEEPKTEKKEWERNAKTIILVDGERLPSSFQLEWLRYENLASYKVLQPTTKEITKELVHKYGRDATNGVILITTNKTDSTTSTK